MSQLEIKDLHVGIDGKEILQGVNLTVKQGEIHAIMGPNGTGKSTLAYALMGHPSYTVTQGEVLFKGQNVLELEPDERSRLGIFPGLPVSRCDSRRDRGELPADGPEFTTAGRQQGRQGDSAP